MYKSPDISLQKLKKQAFSLAHLNSGQVSIGGVKGHGAEPLGVTEASTAPKAAYSAKWWDHRRGEIIHQ